MPGDARRTEEWMRADQSRADDLPAWSSGLPCRSGSLGPVATGFKRAVESHPAPDTPAASPRGLADGENGDSEHEPDRIVALSRTDAERLFGPRVSRPSRVTPLRVVAAQIALSLCVALVWLWFAAPGSAPSALAALLGGALCWVPGGLFALRLKRKNGLDSVTAWVTGGALKMGVTAAMFVAVAFLYHGVRWAPLLVTYLIALKVYWLALAWC